MFVCAWQGGTTRAGTRTPHACWAAFRRRHPRHYLLGLMFDGLGRFCLYIHLPCQTSTWRFVTVHVGMHVSS